MIFFLQWNRDVVVPSRIHGTTKRQVAGMFAEERPALGPLPVEPFRYDHFGARTVHLTGAVEVDGAFYAPRPGGSGAACRCSGTISTSACSTRRRAVSRRWTGVR